MANIDAQQEVTEFDFLVGYDSNNVLDGIVKGVSNVDYDFRTNDYYEVIGQVSGGEEETTLYIIAIRPLTE